MMNHQKYGSISTVATASAAATTMVITTPENYDCSKGRPEGGLGNGEEYPISKTMTMTMMERNQQYYDHQKHCIERGWNCNFTLTATASLLFLVVVVLSMVAIAMTPSDTGVQQQQFLWDDSHVDEWNQFLYQRSLLLVTNMNEIDEEKEETGSSSTNSAGRYLKSQAKKNEHEQKKMEKKRLKYKQKAENDSASRTSGAPVSGLLYLNNTETFRMIRHGGSDKGVMSSSTDDFFHYQNGWEAQINQAYCAVASSVASLNSLRGLIDLPQDPVYRPFPWATQLDVIHNGCVDNAVHDADVVKYVGLGLGLVPGLLNCFLEPQGFVATGHPIDPSTTTVDDVRELVQSALEEPDSRVLLNYDRGAIGQGPMGHGHWSPIGAYHAVTDTFLVMDVAKYKYPPVFVPTENLFHGVSTIDSCWEMGEHPTPVDLTSHDYMKIMNGLGCKPGYRGFVIIRRK